MTMVSAPKIRSIAFAALAMLFAASGFRAQAPTSQTHVPQWQIDAGSSAKFDVAAVRRDNPRDESTQPQNSINFSYTPEASKPTGGLFISRGDSLLEYIYFAYKLRSYQYFTVRPQLSKLSGQQYDIEARATGNPTTDQFRLMMQALLADRFKLKVHYEIRQEPVLALVLGRTLGPSIREHKEDVPCSVGYGRYIAPPKTAFPTSCGSFQEWLKDGRWWAGGRNLTIQEIADQITDIGNDISRQVVDKTSLIGKYDFVIGWTPQFNGTVHPTTSFQPDPSGPTFQEALKAQLGMRLVPQKAPVEVLIIDHVEEPSPN